MFLNGSRPRYARYWEALSSRTGFQVALDGHTHPTVTAGLERLKQAKRSNPPLRDALEGKTLRPT